MDSRPRYVQLLSYECTHSYNICHSEMLLEICGSGICSNQDNFLVTHFALQWILLIPQTATHTGKKGLLKPSWSFAWQKQCIAWVTCRRAALSVFWPCRATDPSEMPSHLVSPKRCVLHLVRGLRGGSRPFSSLGPIPPELAVLARVSRP